MDGQGIMFIFAYTLGAVISFLLCKAHYKEVEGEAKFWKYECGKAITHYEDQLDKYNQPRSSNGRFVSRKQIVTEALRKEQGR